jgi:ribonuclease E
MFEPQTPVVEPAAEVPAVEAAPESAPAQAEPEASPQQPGAPATPGFIPGPPRVGMRPAVVRPAPGGGRMSFSKGVSRQQFRPSGFRPPRPFAPSAPAGEVPPQEQAPVEPVAPVEESGDDPWAMPSRPAQAAPQPSHPQQGHRPQHPHHRGPQQPQGKQQQGQRRDQRHPQQQHGRGRQGQQGRDQRHPQGGGGGHAGHRHPPQQQGHGRGFAPPAQAPASVPEAEMVSQAELPPETIPVPPQLSEAPAGAALSPPTLADSAALAPFAEDIEIEETAAAPAVRRQPTGRDMLINVVEGEEVRIAVIRRGVLEELYMERSSTESHIGNIYKGRVTNVEPSIQAAFIDFGIGKNGFLHISDLHPQYFPKKHQPRMPQPRRVPPARPAAPAPQPEGVAPTASPAEDAGAPSPSLPSEPTPMAHEAAGESPAVQFEETAAEFPAVDSIESTAAGEGDVPAGESAAAAEIAPAETTTEAALDGEEPAPEALLETAGVNTPQESLAEAAEAAKTAAEEDPADFGSAYNAEFADDDGFEGDYDSPDLDDGHMKPMEKVGRKTPRRERPPIQQCLRRGQEVIVQVTKEGIGTKGPTLTSYISCPGRYLVMMPGMAQLGVSRKIEDLDQRRELKRTLQELNPPKNLGFIIRTAGTEVAKKELQGDLNYLVRMWKVIANRIRTHKAPVELYEESDLVIRTIRDVFSDQIDRIIVDNEQVASRVRDFLSIVDPRAAGMVEQYTGTMPLYQKFGVEREIEKINSRRVELANGGSLVIDSTEALVAIDVNSGRYREMRDAELTAFNMNKEALKEVVRQLRLRDLGGVIVIDFIDMREERHKREIERLLRTEMENDRAKTKVLRMSQFCMIEMTRQRVRPSLKRSLYMDCPHCHGSALIKTPESVSLDAMRRLAAGATRMDVARIDVKAYPTVATFLLNRKRKALVELEEKTGKRINIMPDESLAGDQIVLQAVDGRGNLMGLVL